MTGITRVCEGEGERERECVYDVVYLQEFI